MNTPAKLDLELPFIRWAVKTEQWNDIANHSGPYLKAFLAGWFLREIGGKLPDRDIIGQFDNSFTTGWREADSFIEIEKQSDFRKK